MSFRPGPTVLFAALTMLWALPMAILDDPLFAAPSVDQGAGGWPVGEPAEVGVDGGQLLTGALLREVRAVMLPYAFERALWLIRASGYIALGALFLSLSMTPLQRSNPWRSTMAPQAVVRPDEGFISSIEPHESRLWADP